MAIGFQREDRSGAEKRPTERRLTDRRDPEWDGPMKTPGGGHCRIWGMPNGDAKRCLGDPKAHRKTPCFCSAPSVINIGIP